MPKYEVVEAKSQFEVGTVIEADSVPASLAGKVREVPADTKITRKKSEKPQLEVATPKQSEDKPAENAPAE